MILIDTHGKMEDARLRLGHCYMCGQLLPQRGSADWRAETLGEHVIPKSVLNLVVPVHNAWPVELDVHKVCAKQQKDQNDQAAKIVHSFFATPAKNWRKGDMKRFRAKHGMAKVRMPGGDSRPFFENVRSVIHAVSNWRSGMHAALYSVACPQHTREVVQPPVPGFREGSPSEMAKQLEAYFENRDRIMGMLKAASQSGNADRVVAWGGAVNYICTWVSEHDLGELGAMCMWGLELPGVQSWSTTTNGQYVPWHGMYLAARPVGSAELPLEEAANFVRRTMFKNIVLESQIANRELPQTAAAQLRNQAGQ